MVTTSLFKQSKAPTQSVYTPSKKTSDKTGLTSESKDVYTGKQPQSQSISSKPSGSSGSSSKKSSSSNSQTSSKDVYTGVQPQSQSVAPQISPAEVEYNKPQIQNQMSINRMGQSPKAYVGVSGQIITQFQVEEQKRSFIGGYNAGNIELQRQQSIINQKQYTQSDYENQGYKNFLKPSQIDKDKEIANKKIAFASNVGSEVELSYLKAERQRSAIKQPKEELITDFKWYEGLNLANPFASKGSRQKVLKASNQAVNFFEQQEKTTGGQQISTLGTGVLGSKYWGSNRREIFKQDVKATTIATIGAGVKISRGIASIPTYAIRPDRLWKEKPTETIIGGTLGVASIIPQTKVPSMILGKGLGYVAGGMLVTSKKPITLAGDIGESAVPFSVAYTLPRSVVSGSKYVFAPRVKEIYELPQVTFTNEVLSDNIIPKENINYGQFSRIEKSPSRATEFFNLATREDSLGLKQMGKRAEFSISRPQGELFDFQGTGRTRETDVFETARPKEDTITKITEGSKSRNKVNVREQARTKVNIENPFGLKSGISLGVTSQNFGVSKNIIKADSFTKSFSLVSPSSITKPSSIIDSFGITTPQYDGFSSSRSFDFASSKPSNIPASNWNTQITDSIFEQPKGNDFYPLIWVDKGGGNSGFGFFNRRKKKRKYVYQPTVFSVITGSRSNINEGLGLKSGFSIRPLRL